MIMLINSSWHDRNCWKQKRRTIPIKSNEHRSKSGRRTVCTTQKSNLRRPPPLFPNCIFINIFDKRDPIVNCPLHLNCTTAMLHTIDNTAFKSPPPQHHHHHPLSTTHARTHARPSLPIVQDPNPTPPNWHPVELHDTAASSKWTLRTM